MAARVAWKEEQNKLDDLKGAAMFPCDITSAEKLSKLEQHVETK